METIFQTQTNLCIGWDGHHKNQQNSIEKYEKGEIKVELRRKHFATLKYFSAAQKFDRVQIQFSLL